MNSLAVIIPAAGSGSRMQKEIPKPYLRIAGSTILEHTVSRFTGIDALKQIIIATTNDRINETRALLKPLVGDAVQLDCIEGGRERQFSIFNALKKVGAVELVAVHDAVRPFADKAQIIECCEAALETGGAILGIPAQDTIKRVDERSMIRETPDRKYLWQSQTPQIFQKEILMEAYESAIKDEFVGTDDASLVERRNKPVKVVHGSRQNFKITYPFDLKLAELLLNEQQGE